MLQAAQSVLISLFQLNTPEFSMLLAALPKTFQDGATKLLQNHLKNTGNVAQVKHTHQLPVCVGRARDAVTSEPFVFFFFFRHQWAAL